MTSLKRDATNRIPMDHSLPNILGQPTVAFHLLPLAGAAAKAASPKEKPPGTKKRSRVQFANPRLGRKEELKVEKESNEDQTFQLGCSIKPWKLLRGKGFVEVSTFPTVVRLQSPEKVVPKASTCVLNRGASNPILYKGTVEKMKVSLLASLLLDGRLAKFCTRDFCGHRSFNGQFENFGVS